MTVEQATEREQQDIAALEHFALGLRFHGFEEKAERVEQRAEQMRAEIWQRRSVTPTEEVANYGPIGRQRPAMEAM